MLKDIDRFVVHFEHFAQKALNDVRLPLNLKSAYYDDLKQSTLIALVRTGWTCIGKFDPLPDDLEEIIAFVTYTYFHQYWPEEFRSWRRGAYTICPPFRKLWNERWRERNLPEVLSSDHTDETLAFITNIAADLDDRDPTVTRADIWQRFERLSDRDTQTAAMRLEGATLNQISTGLGCGGQSTGTRAINHLKKSMRD